MAAIITIGTLALAADGITLTGQLAGGSGGYLPASGATLLTVKQTGSGGPSVYTQASVVITSGGLVTIVLNSVAPSGVPLTLDLAAGSNITDSSANTPTGQAALAVTNNSTVAATGFTLAGSAAVFSPNAAGAPNVWTNATRATHNVTQMHDPAGQIDGQFNGTSLQLNMDAQISNVCFKYLTIDGADVALPATAGTVDVHQWVTLIASLASGNHTFTIKFTQASNAIYVDRDVAFRVIGGAQTMAAPANFGTQTYLVGAGVSPHILFEGDVRSWLVEATDYRTIRPDGLPAYDSAMTFKATISAVWVWVSLTAGKFQLIVDRDTANPTTFNATAPVKSATAWVQVATGLDSANEHLYTLVNTQPNAAPVQHYYLMTSGGTGINFAANPAVTGVIAGYGDSIVAGVAGTGDTAQSMLNMLARKLGKAMVNRGVGSTTVFQVVPGVLVTNADSMSVRMSEITSLSPAPSVLLVNGGTNDLTANATITTANLQAAVTTEINALVAGLPGTTKILYLGILPRSAFTQAVVDTWNAAIVAGIAGAGSPSNVTFVNPKPWNLGGVAYVTGGAFDPTNYGDGTLHPNLAGYTIIVNNLIPLLSAGLRLNRGMSGGMVDYLCGGIAA